MKKKKLLDAMSLADESFVREADPSKRTQKKPKWRSLSLVAACLCLVMLIGGTTLFMPFNTAPDDLSAYKKSEYYDVLTKLNLLNYEKPKYKNNYEKLTAAIEDMFEDAAREVMGGFGAAMNGAVMPEADFAVDDGFIYEAVADSVTATGSAATKGDHDFYYSAPIEEAESSDSDAYKEITDNQVAGVIEADRIKRSEKHIFYLDGSTLRVFDIAGMDSKELGSYTLYNGERDYMVNKWEFYLTSDCKSVVLMTTYMENSQLCTGLVTLDVSNPENIKESGSFAITGSYLTSRSVDGKIILVSQYLFEKSKMDFDKLETFVPMYDTGDGLEPIPADCIVIPEEVHSPRYTVAMILDEKSLELKATSANLSYMDDVYVTKERIYLARVFEDEIKNADLPYGTMTEITCLDYTSDEFKEVGSVTVRGYIKDQWSMDEYDGILRIVTTTNGLDEWHLSGGYRPVSGDVLLSASGGSSASLYCVDANTWEIVASVEEFAPKYEEVQSVRFDGTMAYVCTSIEMSDPVFFFDLSDLSNITFKDTGTIEGYSSSLVNFGNGYLLGIGMGGWNTFKVEIYEETEDGVRSVASYIKEGADYSTEYKSYLIDRENQLVGLGINISGNYYFKDDAFTQNTEQGSKYILLHFNGFEIAEIVCEDLAGDPETQRGTVIDDYLYMFGAEDFKLADVSVVTK